MTDPHEPDLEAAKQRLLAMRDELRQATQDTEEARRPIELDQTSVGRLSRMDSMQMQAMAQEAERRRGLELRRVEAALRRIADGSYGVCVRCGEDIDAKRLALVPTVPTCVGCAREAG